MYFDLIYTGNFHNTHVSSARINGGQGFRIAACSHHFLSGLTALPVSSPGLRLQSGPGCLKTHVASRSRRSYPVLHGQQSGAETRNLAQTIRVAHVLALCAPQAAVIHRKAGGVQVHPTWPVLILYHRRYNHAITCNLN